MAGMGWVGWGGGGKNACIVMFCLLGKVLFGLLIYCVYGLHRVCMSRFRCVLEENQLKRAIKDLDQLGTEGSRILEIFSNKKIITGTKL